MIDAMQVRQTRVVAELEGVHRNKLERLEEQSGAWKRQQDHCAAVQLQLQDTRAMLVSDAACAVAFSRMNSALLLNSISEEPSVASAFRVTVDPSLVLGFVDSVGIVLADCHQPPLTGAFQGEKKFGITDNLCFSEDGEFCLGKSSTFVDRHVAIKVFFVRFCDANLQSIFKWPFSLHSFVPSTGLSGLQPQRGAHIWWFGAEAASSRGVSRWRCGGDGQGAALFVCLQTQ